MSNVQEGGPGDPTREELIQLCTDGVVPHDKWRNRDSAGAQIQLGQARALLAAGCDFRVLRGSNYLSSNDRTWWLWIEWHGFDYFEWGVGTDDDTFYLPTRARLDRAAGGDWVLMAENAFEREPGKKAGWNCDEKGCQKTVQDGPLWRVNPKGRPGIFMCGEHEVESWTWRK